MDEDLKNRLIDLAIKEIEVGEPPWVGRYFSFDEKEIKEYEALVKIYEESK